MMLKWNLHYSMLIHLPIRKSSCYEKCLCNQNQFYHCQEWLVCMINEDSWNDFTLKLEFSGEKSRSVSWLLMTWLAPCITRSSAAIILNMQHEQHVVFHEEGSQLPTPFQCWKMIQNANITLHSLRKTQHMKRQYHRLTLISSWISNYIQHKVWGEIIYPFPNFNSAAVEVWEWRSNFIAQSIGHVIIYPCWD